MGILHIAAVQLKQRCNIFSLVFPQLNRWKMPFIAHKNVIISVAVEYFRDQKAFLPRRPKHDDSEKKEMKSAA